MGTEIKSGFASLEALLSKKTSHRVKVRPQALTGQVRCWVHPRAKSKPPIHSGNLNKSKFVRFFLLLATMLHPCVGMVPMPSVIAPPAEVTTVPNAHSWQAESMSHWSDDAEPPVDSITPEFLEFLRQRSQAWEAAAQLAAEELDEDERQAADDPSDDFGNRQWGCVHLGRKIRSQKLGHLSPRPHELWKGQIHGSSCHCYYNTCRDQGLDLSHLG